MLRHGRMTFICVYLRLSVVYILLPSVYFAVRSFFISLPSKKRSKENAPEIAASILTKAGNRAQNKARVSLSSLLPSLFRRIYSKGERVVSTVAEKSCLTHTERPLNCVRGDRRDASTTLSMTLFLRGEFVFSTLWRNPKHDFLRKR